MHPVIRAATLSRRGILNYFQKRPFCVSFEITHDCNAHCDHCHLGGKVDTRRATPEEFAARYRELKPIVIQISGGEPLLRKDAYEIVESLRHPNGVPYIIFVTNASFLTEEKYFRLRHSGVDVFSVSLDFPDERHDEFRSIPGLFGKIRDLASAVTARGDEGVTLNSVVHSRNFRELLKMAETARDWGVSINFSPYTWLRTGDKSYLIGGDDLPEFRDIIQRLIDFKSRYGVIRTSDSFMWDIAAFFQSKSRPGCRAGERFLVVNPDATLSPCGLIITDYTSWSGLKKGFCASNTCSFCNTSIRANTESPVNNLLRGGLSSLFEMSKTQSAAG